MDRVLFDMEYWSYNLPDQVKIHEACHMMKDQGVEFPYMEPSTIAHVKAGEGVCALTARNVLLVIHVQFMDVSPLHTRESPLEQDKKKADVCFNYQPQITCS